MPRSQSNSKSSKSKHRDTLQDQYDPNKEQSTYAEVKIRKSKLCLCGSKKHDRRCRAGDDAFCRKSKSSSSVCSDSETEISQKHYDNLTEENLRDRQSNMSKSKKSNRSVLTEGTGETTQLGDSRLYAGKQSMQPKKHMEYQGQEIIQVVEELMEQTSILKKRLVDMIYYFQSTVCTCAQDLTQASDFQKQVCGCKSNLTGTDSVDCRSKGGEEKKTEEQSGEEQNGDEQNGDEQNNDSESRGATRSKLRSEPRSELRSERSSEPRGDQRDSAKPCPCPSLVKNYGKIPSEQESNISRSSKKPARHENSSRLLSGLTLNLSKSSKKTDGLRSILEQKSFPQSVTRSKSSSKRTQHFQTDENLCMMSSCQSCLRLSEKRSCTEKCFKPGSQGTESCLCLQKLKESDNMKPIFGVSSTKSALKSEKVRSNTASPSSLIFFKSSSNNTPEKLDKDRFEQGRRTEPEFRAGSEDSAIFKDDQKEYRQASNISEPNKQSMYEEDSTEENEVDSQPSTYGTTMKSMPESRRSHYTDRNPNSMKSTNESVRTKTDAMQQSGQSSSQNTSYNESRILQEKTNVFMEPTRSILKSNEPRNPNTESKRTLVKIKVASDHDSNARNAVSTTPSEGKKVEDPSRSRGGVFTEEGTSKEKSSLYLTANHTDLTQKVFKVQQDIKDLRKQMTQFQGCSCNCRNEERSNVFSESLSAQLLGKADEIKALLRDLRSDCYQQDNMSGEELPDAGQQKVIQKCEKEIRRVHPEFNRTINQVQNIEGDRNRSGNIRTAKLSEAVETKVNTKYKDQDKPEDVLLKTKVEANERVEDLGEDDAHRQTKTLAERTLKTTDKAIREVNVTNENDVRHAGGRVIKTTKKIVRTEILAGQEPKERVITNIKIRRIVNNKIGKITETVTEVDEDSDEDEPMDKVESPIFSEGRAAGGHSENLSRNDSDDSISIFVGKRSYEEPSGSQQAASNHLEYQPNEPVMAATSRAPSSRSKYIPPTSLTMLNDNRMQKKQEVQSKLSSKHTNKEIIDNEDMTYGKDMTYDENIARASAYVSRSSNVDDEPPTKSRRTYYSDSTVPDEIRVAQTPAPSEHFIYSKNTKMLAQPSNMDPDYHIEDDRISAGASLHSGCSKVVYVAPSSDVPGVDYIGCKDSDMCKYASERSQVTADNRLITTSMSSKRTNRLSNPSRYSRSLAGIDDEVDVHSKIVSQQKYIAAPMSSQTAQLQSKQLSHATNQSRASYPAGYGQQPGPSYMKSTKSSQNRKINPTQSNISKPYFRERNNSLERTHGGTTIHPSNAGSSMKSSEPVADCKGSYFTQQSQVKSVGNTISTIVPPIQPQDLENITDVIAELSGNRSPKEFFVSVLPEKIQAKTFRINVIDKESGNLLGYFFVDEQKFKQARDDGVFDNYLSLFVLNSLGSYSDFVRMKSTINPKALKHYQCFGKCACKEEEQQ